MVMLLWARNGPRNHKLDGVQILHRKGQFLGKGRPLFIKYRDCRELCKTAEPIELWTRVGARKQSSIKGTEAEVTVCPHGRYIGATWRIRLNRPSAAAIGLYGLMSNYFDHLFLGCCKCIPSVILCVFRCGHCKYLFVSEQK